MFGPEITVLVQSGEHLPATKADYVSRALRAEHQVNQSQKEQAKLYEVRSVMKGHESVKGRNEKFNPRSG